ncbi:MAG: hypothetical protein WBP12_04430 [Candidatus Saccharimonas sp.]
MIRDHPLRINHIVAAIEAGLRESVAVAAAVVSTLIKADNARMFPETLYTLLACTAKDSVTTIVSVLDVATISDMELLAKTQDPFGGRSPFRDILHPSFD